MSSSPWPAMRARSVHCATCLLGLGFSGLFRIAVFRICENWVITTGTSDSTGSNMDTRHGVDKLVRANVARLARLASSTSLGTSSLGLGSRLLRVVIRIAVQIAIARSVRRSSKHRNRGVLQGTCLRTACKQVVGNRNRIVRSNDRSRSDIGRTFVRTDGRSSSGTNRRSGTTLRTSLDDRRRRLRGLEGLGKGHGGKV